MNKPKAVLISDVHYNLQTLELADKAVRLAITKANDLDVPLIVCGDLHDTKANMRAECLNAMIKTFATAKYRPFILVGNHDKINEKSEEHSLEFLNKYAHILNKPHRWANLNLLPYYPSAEGLKHNLKSMAGNNDTVVMHQGIMGAEMGHYFQDKSALTKQDLAGIRVISGHYHERQSFDLPKGGRFDYVGNPYTLGFGEANHPEKGYQILMDDGSLEFVPTNLRKHVIIDLYAGCTREDVLKNKINDNDIIWVKVHGSSESILEDATTENIKHFLGLKQDIKLTLHPDEAVVAVQELDEIATVSYQLDAIIDSVKNIEENQKLRLKDLWRKFE